MNIVAINGSARKQGNTHILLETALAPLAQAGHQCEIIELAGLDIRGCKACGGCKAKQNSTCTGRNDDLNPIMAKLFQADAILLGSPTYFADVSAEMKALIDRVGYVSMANGGLLVRKVGAAVVAVRRGGAIHTFDTMNHLFTISQMITVGSTYWNMGVGGPAGDVANDEEGMRTMRILGENMEWLLARLQNRD